MGIDWDALAARRGIITSVTALGGELYRYRVRGPAGVIERDLPGQEHPLAALYGLAMDHEPDEDDIDLRALVDAITATALVEIGLARLRHFPLTR